MAGQQADLAFSDPPYNVGYEGYTDQKLTIQNDSMTPQAFELFLRNSFAAFGALSSRAGHCTFATPPRRSGTLKPRWRPPDSRFAARLSGRRTRSHGASDATSSSMSRSSIAMWRGTVIPGMATNRKSTLWQEKKPAANKLHPTMKPVELIERALVNSSKPGDCVLDLFGGSGSTLLACERRGRNARLMEVDSQVLRCDREALAGIRRRTGGPGGNRAELR